MPTFHRVTRKIKEIAGNVPWLIFDRLDTVKVSHGSYEITDDQKQHWREHGWVALRGSASANAIDECLREIDDFRSSGRGGRDEYGRGFRIGLIHAVKKHALRMALNDHARQFLQWAFEDEPILFGSLTFDIGTEQEAHIDAAFFYTQPEESMAGVWTALEDIHPDSGPLFYIDKSHAFPMLYASEVLDRNPELARRIQEHRATGAPPDLDLSNEVYAEYSLLLQERIKERGAEKMPAMMKKGDIFIWHGRLIHGGLPRKNRELTRRSMVVHYYGASSKFYDQHQFFLRGDILNETPPVQFKIRESRHGRYVKWPDAVTFEKGDGHFEA